MFSLRVGRAVLAVVFLWAVGGTALAGDPARYADRGQWPAWSTQYASPKSDYPVDGELVDAIRFELIRGYPVTAEDYMKYQDREFRPDRQMTRAEFTAVSSRSQALVTEDAKDGAWYAPYAAALKAQGIIPAGASEEWEGPISRREAGQWMGWAAELFKADDVKDGRVFADVDDPVILRALRAGIVKGTGAGRYEPDRALLRVEAAVMLVRLARARNAEGNAGKSQVVETLQGVIREADRQATEGGKRWIKLGHLDGVETGGVLSQEMAEYLDFRARDSVEVHQKPPETWGLHVPDQYQFTAIEIHDTTATVQACGLTRIYRANDPMDKPWFERPYCERQFLILRDGHWLLSAAANLTQDR